MSRRTTIVLAVIAGALAIYIVAFEGEGLSDSDLLARRGSVFVEFDRERVTRIAIARGEETIAIQRRESAEDEDEFSARYDLVEPVRAPADSDAVDALLSSIEWAEDRRRLEGQTDEDRARFGLDDSPLSGSLVVAGRETPFRFGGADPQGGGRYLIVGDETVVFVVGNDLFEAFDHDAAHFRSRDLFEDGLGRATSIVSGDVRVEQREGRYWFGDGTLASETKIRELVSALGEARALSFEDDASDASRFGLDRTLRIETGDGRVVVKVGSECGEGEARGRYVRVGEGPIACVASETTDALVLDPATMRDRRPIGMRSEEIQSIEITDGATVVRLERADDRWKVGDETADDVAISELYDGLKRVEAEVLVVAEAELATYGFGARSITLRADEGTEALELGRIEGETAFLHRRGENAVLRVPATAVSFFEASALRYQNREIGTFDAAGLEALSIERAGTAETVRRGPEGFTYEPGPAEIDEEHLRRVARLLAALRAERWVTSTADASHGLAPPVMTVSATFEHTDDHGHATGESDSLEIKVGTPTDGGAFAQIGDGGVFVINTEVLEALERPLAAGTTPLPLE